MASASQAAKEAKRKQLKKMQLIILMICYVIGLIFLLRILAFRYMYPGSGISEAAGYVLKSPADFTGVGDVFKKNFGPIFLFSIVAFLLMYIFSVDRSLKKRDNPETVHGSAHFMGADEQKQYNREKTDPIGYERNDGPNNVIFSKEIYLAIDNKATRRNLNVLVIGGSGAGKSFFFIAPNIMQFNCNYVITDPSGELLRDYGKTLEDHGYKIKIFNLTDVYKGNRYNPFHYIHSEKDVFTLTETLMKNTTPPGKGGGDPFWEQAEKLLLNVAILYLWHMYPEEQQNFSNVVNLIQQAAKVAEDEETTTGEDAKTVLDQMIEEIEEVDPHNLTVRQYKSFKLGADKTVRSILISCSSRLEAFTLADIEYLTSVDDMHFETFTDTKQALFVITPTADTTFGFLTAMLFSQMFSIFYTYCETQAGLGWQAYIPMESHYRLSFMDKMKHKKYPTGGREIIKIVQAKDADESSNAEKQIKGLVNCIKHNGTVIKHEKNGMYRIYTKNRKGKEILLGWRGTETLAKNFAERLKETKAEKCGDRCPNHVRFLLDEFANIGEIPDFDQKLATMRKYEISCSIVIQAISQLQQHYKDSWNTIAGNCDTKIFLGSDDNETIKWLIETTGKKTVRTASESYQTSGGGSTSISTGGEDLITPDRVSMLDENECIVRIRGLPLYQGPKYRTMNHPQFAYAMKTKGTYHVKTRLTEKQKLSLIPLHERLRMEGKGRGMPGGTKKAGEPAADEPKKRTSDEKKDIEKKKNRARKDEAKRATAEKKALEEAMNEDVNEFTDEDAKAFTDSFDIDLDDSDESIQEKVSSALELGDPDMEVMDYILSE